MINVQSLSKEERIQLVLEGVLSSEYVTYEEVMEILDTVESLVFERGIVDQQTHYAPTTLQ